MDGISTDQWLDDSAGPSLWSLVSDLITASGRVCELEDGRLRVFEARAFYIDSAGPGADL